KNNLLVKDLQIGKSILDPIEPLSTDHAELEISDIIAGVPTPENLINKNYPFPVVPAPQLFNEDPLMIYIEVYHLNLGSDGRAHFDVEFSYEILKKRRFRSDKIERVSQQFPFQSTSTTAKEMAGFDVSDLKAGDYDFTITVTDKTSGKSKERTGKIKIIAEEGK
ncbi:MAG: hypothetical protein GY863_16575, partial [bacterium]|nr:hypothetical protein [bacterium]